MWGVHLNFSNTFATLYKTLFNSRFWSIDHHVTQ